MLQVFHLNVTKIDQDFASVSGVFILMLQVFHLDVCICLQWLHMCFQVCSSVLNVFQTYVTNVLAVSDYVASISSACCKSRSGVAHVVMRVRSGEGASGPRAGSSGTGDVQATRMGACWLERMRGVQAHAEEMECRPRSGAGVCPDVRALALSIMKWVCQILETATIQTFAN
jgi:hypothetical protein